MRGATTFRIVWLKTRLRDHVGEVPPDKVDIVRPIRGQPALRTRRSRRYSRISEPRSWDNTVVVIGGDNGEAFYEHGFAAHASSLFNEVMKVPMIIRAPGLQPGLDARPAMFLDVPPSVFDLMGLPAHPGFQGISLFEPNPDPNRSIYMIVQTPAAFQSAIVRSGFKLLYSEWDGRNYLYDLVNDPTETPTKNLARSRPDLLADLTDRLRLWRREQLSYYADVPRQSRVTCRQGRSPAPSSLFAVLALPAAMARRGPPARHRPAASTTVQLQRDIDAVLAAPALARSTWGILIRSARSNDTLYSLNAGKLLMPGSTMKIVTLAAAAEALGWDHVYDTRLIAAGTIDSTTGILDGDLVVAGSGDPSIVDADGSASRLFSEWTATLTAHGIRTITGRIIGDDNTFDDEALGPGWTWDDLPGRDATAITGLQFNENVAFATITPGPAIGAPAVVTIAPDGSNLVLDNRLTTTAAETAVSIGARRSPGSNRLELRGSIPIGSGPFVRAVSVDNPTLFFATAFRDALVGAGIEVRGPAVDVDDLAVAPAGGDVLSVHHSPPLSELAVRLMKNSLNMSAETLMKTLGATTGAPSFENGRLVTASTLAPWGVDRNGIVQVDGAGLSRYNYVTPEALVAILLHIDRDDRLRAPSQRRCRLRDRRHSGGPNEGNCGRRNARAKSGTLANVRSLAGYLATADGEPLVFAIIANNFGTNPETAIAAIDAIVVKLAEFRR